MDRRQFLTTITVVLSTPLVGCLDGTPLAGDATPGRPWTPSESGQTPDGTHHLFIENHTETPETAWVRVTSEAGGTLVNGRYELPDMRGIQFEAIGRWETTYAIDISIDGEEPVSLEWVTAECGPDSEAPDGSRNASVRVTEPSGDDDRVELLIDQCDALYAPGVPAGSAEYFRLDE
jgi:hypothetical protein